MSNKPNTETVFTSLIWKLLERGGTQGVQLFIQIILARLLSPNDFGMLALVLVFINLAQVFIQSGFNTALIQKEEVDNEDYSSVFYLSLAIAGILYLLIYFLSPTFSKFYKTEELTAVLRILSLILFTGAINSIQNAVISRNMQFKLLFKSSLIAIIISGTFGILAAYNNLGIWALVIQQLTNQILITVILFFTVNWRPKLIFSYSKIKTLFSYGWKLLVSSLLEILYIDMSTLIIGRIYSPSILGFFNRGEQFPKTIVNNLNGSIQSVMLPTLSAHQMNTKRVREMVRRSIKISSFIVFPMMLGMFAVSEPLIKIILGEQWLPAVPYLQIFCIIYAMMPIHTANLQAINALGRSDIFLKIEIIKKTIDIIILFYTIPKGVIAIALGQVLSGMIGSFINAYPNQQLLGYKYKEQLIDVLPNLVISIIMCVFIYMIRFLNLSVYAQFITQVILGITIYLILVNIFHIESYTYLLNVLRNYKTQEGR